MPVGIGDFEAAIPVSHGIKFLRHFHAFAGQIRAQLVGIVGLKADVRQSILLGFLQLGKDLNVLVVVHLEVREQQPAAFRGRTVVRKWLLVAEHVAVELARGSKIVGAHADVRDAENLGTRNGRVLPENEVRKQKGNEEDSGGGFHGGSDSATAVLKASRQAGSSLIYNVR